MNNIKKLRRDSNLTVRDLSKKSKLSQGYLSELENGKSSNPSLDVMERISKSLGKTVVEVFFKEA